MIGLVTPRECLKELIDMANHTRGDHWKAKNYRMVLKQLERTPFKSGTVADTPMSMAAFDAVVKEAWDKIKNGPDAIEQMIRNMAAQGRA